MHRIVKQTFHHDPAEGAENQCPKLTIFVFSYTLFYRHIPENRRNNRTRGSFPISLCLKGRFFNFFTGFSYFSMVPIKTKKMIVYNSAVKPVTANGLVIKIPTNSKNQCKDRPTQENRIAHFLLLAYQNKRRRTDQQPDQQYSIRQGAC